MDAQQGIDPIDDLISALGLANIDRTDDMLPIILTNTTGTCLQDLHEYCLLEIFSSDSLTPMDLCSLAETCKRFKQITQRVFPKDLSIESEFVSPLQHLNSITMFGDCFHRPPQFYELESEKFRRFEVPMSDVERILKNFGPALSKLSIKQWDQALANVVARHCDDVTLKFLKIENMKVHLTSIFQRSLKLFMVKCDLLDTSAGFNYNSLIDLEIAYSSGWIAVLKCTFPNLERFCLHVQSVGNNYNCNNNDIFPEFISRHNRLRILTLFGPVNCTSKLLHTIAISCEELEELNILANGRPQISFELSSLHRLSKLRMLKISIYSEPLLVLYLRAAVPLESVNLHFEDDVPIEFFVVLSQLQNLHELQVIGHSFNRIPWKMLTQLKNLHLGGISFRSEISDYHVLKVIRELTNLELLTLRSFVLGEKDFFEIVKIVEKRAHVLKLKCSYNFGFDENCDNNRKVRLIKN